MDTPRDENHSRRTRRGACLRPERLGPQGWASRTCCCSRSSPCHVAHVPVVNSVVGFGRATSDHHRIITESTYWRTVSLEYCLGMLPVMRFFDTSRSLPVSHQQPPREDQRRSTCLTPSRGHWRHTCPRWDHWDGSRAKTAHNPRLTSGPPAC